jgi:histidine ammonia-lyase
MPIKYAAGKTASLLAIAASPPTPSRKRKTSLISGSLTRVPIFLKNYGTSSGRMINAVIVTAMNSSNHPM